MIDGLPCETKEPFDFGFLKEYGRVFQVFDGQDSGNLCFGLEKAGERRFVKFAGAPAKEYDGEPADAIRRLQAAQPPYRALCHKNLVQLLEAREIGGGFALVFRWAQGDCMGRAYPAAHKRFMGLPAAARLQVFEDILDFLRHVHACGYMPVDFYDGSILYDFESGRTTVCDIDFFRKKPCRNDVGRMWGSSRFMSPEEFLLGAALDERTSVYTAGAFAFALFGGYSRERSSWQLSEALFEAAARAVSEERELRQPTLEYFSEEWKKALHAPEGGR
ncbi:MAG: serine/threonine protein kinase [Provencibacterium sp.]|nr:serine/threonine protein kinase [Provencibacterium sp.]